MASVAVCPHCFVQLSVPDGTARDAHVGCPTCLREFDLTLTVIRPIPEIVMVERAAMDEDDRANVNEEREAEDPIAAFAATAREAELELERLADVGQDRMAAEDSEAEPPHADELAGETQAEIEPPAEPVEHADVSPVRPATLAELMAAREAEAETAEVVAVATGPSFDLPNVPLVRESGATVEFESISEFSDVGVSTNTEFELDDVDFETHSADTVAETAEEFFADEAEFAPVETAESAKFHPHTGVEEFPDATIIPTPPPRRRKRSAVRMLVGTALGGFFGLAIGYYFLMLLLGPRGDFLEMARYLPAQVLPTSFGDPGTRLAREMPATELAEVPEVPPVAVTPDEPPTDVATMEEPSESENIPAAYEETTPPDTGESTIDELLATDSAPALPPAEFAEAPAEPLPTTPIEDTPPTLPLTGPSYTAGEFEKLLATAELAEAGLIDGDLSDAAVRRTKGLSYAKLCDLAHAIVFVQLTPEDANGTELQSQAAKVFENALATPHARDEVARIAAIWIESPHRRHGGVFLAGTVSGGQIAGDVYEYDLTAPDGGRYTVLSSRPLDSVADSADTAVAIVGTVVEHPTADVSGYTGTAERAIFASQALPLP